MTDKLKFAAFYLSIVLSIWIAKIIEEVMK